MKITKLIFSILILLSYFPANTYSQGPASFEISDEFDVGGDIFTDFNEDIESTKIIEEERFYRYGRFYSFNLSFGLTSFNGTRGQAYEDNFPGYGLSVHFFTNFQSAFGLGIESSKHHFFIDSDVKGYKTVTPGLIDVNMLRAFFSYRYYIDTSNLGTAITYANPYLTARMEYWYVSHKFPEEPSIGDYVYGALGSAIGFGLEFPIEIKEYYLGIEFLYHRVNFADKYTKNFSPLYDDMVGDPYSYMVTYVINW